MPVEYTVNGNEKKTLDGVLLPANRRVLVETAARTLVADDHGAVVCFNAAAGFTVTLPTPAWDTLSKERTALALPERLGEVICDSIRLRWLDPQVHAKAAPASLPTPAADWLKHLARALEEAGEPRRATELRAAIEQFATR